MNTEEKIAKLNSKKEVAIYCIENLEEEYARLTEQIEALTKMRMNCGARLSSAKETLASIERDIENWSE